MYRVNGEQCKKCGKLFRPDNKVLKMVDADGNELHIDLCNSCELDTMTEEVMESMHISREEAEKYIFAKVNETIYNIKPYDNNEILSNMDNWIKQITDKKSTTSNKIKKQGFKYIRDIEPNKVVRMVK